MQIIPGPELF